MAGDGLASTPKHTWRSGLKHKEVGPFSPISGPATQPPKCPECASTRVWKDGLRQTENGTVQRYLCRDCGFRFSQTLDPKVKVDVGPKVPILPEPVQNLGDLNSVRGGGGSVDEGLKDLPLPFGEDVASHKFTNVAKAINTLLHNSRDRRVCDSERESKNLATEEPQQERAGAGATQKLSETDIKGKIVEYAWHLKKQGYAESTIKTRTDLFKILVKEGANLLNPESVKIVLSKLERWEPGSKAVAVEGYNGFAKFNGLSWEPPRYKSTQKMPFVPMEIEIDQVIAGCGKKTGTFSQAIKESGARPGEIWRLKWTDLDTEHGILRINHPEKDSNPRIVKVSSKLVAMLNALPKRSQRIFGGTGTLRGLGISFLMTRKKVARTLQNPRMEKVTWCSMRHWRGTMEYHKTKDILHVMKVLGHKNIKNTLVYIDLENAIFQTQNDEFTVRVAKTLDEACQLLEVGFEYVTDMDGAKLFRRRK